ncbi:hypothetical protein PIB30_099231 [Stylosanthes scabra]|uniref:Uncharacterized protein n=1 Tax=Stylosanthes scabra TaxID=79078 RepID=A0ABU6XVZ9_9FABA|nr:hypothetical protein [Stylosanthes scabra]
MGDRSTHESIEAQVPGFDSSSKGKLHLSKPPLAFPNVIARLLEESGVDYNALDSDDKVPKGRPITAEVMENIRHPQHHSPPPHQSPQLHQFHEQPFSPSPQYQSQHHFE